MTASRLVPFTHPLVPLFDAAIDSLSVALAPESTRQYRGTVRGFLAGEPFYQGRPARYWREVLRKCGRAGNIPLETATRFQSTKATLPVLRVCARDPDRNVRWPAVALLGQRDYPTQASQEVLIEALQDRDTEVRLQAIFGLAQSAEAMQDNQTATKEYKRFLQIWKNADQNLPEITTAKRFLTPNR